MRQPYEKPKIMVDRDLGGPVRGEQLLERVERVVRDFQNCLLPSNPAAVVSWAASSVGSKTGRWRRI